MKYKIVQSQLMNTALVNFLNRQLSKCGESLRFINQLIKYTFMIRIKMFGMNIKQNWLKKQMAQNALKLNNETNELFLTHKNISPEEICHLHSRSMEKE